MTRRQAIGLTSVLAVALIVPASGRAAGASAVAGVPAKLVGAHGPIMDYASGALQMVGHTDLAAPGSKVALGNNGGVAVVDHCAYVGRWHDYDDAAAKKPTKQQTIQIVDVANPAKPLVVKGGVPGSAIPGAVAREIRAVDVPGFRMLSVLTFSKYVDSGITADKLNAMYYYLVDLKDCRKVTLAGSYQMKAIRGHEFFQFVDPNTAHNWDGHPRIVDFVTTPLGGIDGVVIDASDPAAPKLISTWDGGQPYASAKEANLASQSPAGAGRYSHSISLSPDGRTAYVSQWDGGYFALDASSFADKGAVQALRPAGAMSVPLRDDPLGVGNTHSAVVARDGKTVVLGDEIYATTDGCPFGWMHVASVGSATQPAAVLGEYKLAENQPAACNGKITNDRNSLGKDIDGTFTMHNQTVTSRFVITTWYGGGVRAVDISNPASPTEVGAFVPKPVPSTVSIPDTSAPVYGATADESDDWWVSMWSYPVIRNGLIYVSDIRNGLYILRAKPGTPLAKELAGIKFLEGNSNRDVLGR